jgi:ribosomal protein S18 acetylase RimI-like enzyme
MADFCSKIFYANDEETSVSDISDAAAFEANEMRHRLLLYNTLMLKVEDQENTILGYAEISAVSKSVAFVRNVCIEKSCRRLGLGRKLLTSENF